MRHLILMGSTFIFSTVENMAAIWRRFMAITFKFSLASKKFTQLHQVEHFQTKYSHLSNNRGGWNKRGGGPKVAKSINVEVGINVEGGIFWKKLVHKCNKRGVAGGKNLRNQ